MTPLPKHLEEMRDELAEKNADTFYHAQGDIHQTMPWSDCKESYQNGFNQATSILLKDMESLAKALEDLEGHTIAHLQFPHKETSNLTVAIINAREALKIWREKYEAKNENNT